MILLYFIGLDVHKDTVPFAIKKINFTRRGYLSQYLWWEQYSSGKSTTQACKTARSKTPRFQNRITNGHPEPSTLDQCHQLRSYTGQQPVTSMFATAQSKLSFGFSAFIVFIRFDARIEILV